MKPFSFALVLVVLLISVNSSAKQVKTPEEAMLEKAWATTGVGYADLEKYLSNKVCKYDLEEFEACLDGINTMYGTIDEDFVLFPRRFLSLSYVQIVKLEKTFGDFVLVKSAGLARQAFTVRRHFEMIKEASTELKTVRDLSFRESKIDFSEIFKDIQIRAKAAKVHPAVATAAYLGGSFGSKDHYHYLMPLSFYKAMEARPETKETDSGLEPVISADGSWRVGKAVGHAIATGFRQGDIVIEMGGLPVPGTPIQDLMDVVESSIKTNKPYTMTINRNGTIKKLPVRQGVIKEPMVHSGLIPELAKTGRIRVKEFNEPYTCRMFSSQLGALLKKGISRLLLDVRGNPGGSVDDVACMATLLVGPDERVLELGYESIETNLMLVSDNPRNHPQIEKLIESASKLKIVVLVDKNSASGGEALPAALRKAAPDRVILVGTLTHGKGTFQTGDMWSENDKVIEFQTSGEYTLYGSTPNNAGVEPDFKVPWRIGGENDDEVKFTQSEELMLGGKLMEVGTPLQREDKKPVEKIEKCINKDSLRAAQEKEFGSAKGFDYRLAFGLEVLRCM